MSVVLTLTAAGRAALADATNRATRAVQLRRLAVGTGTAPASTDDSARTALRAQREIAAVTGDTTVPARIAFRADYRPDAAWNVTEIGLFARIGATGDEFLFAYWVAASAADAAAAAVDGARLVIAGIVEIAQSNAALTVTVGPTVRVGAPGQATTSAQGVVELATAAEARAGTDTERAVTPAGVASALAGVGGVPTGTVLDFAGSVAPSGYLLCQGQSVSRTTYAALFAVVGLSYAPTNEHVHHNTSGTFRLPDLRRRVVVGAGGSATSRLANTIGATGGSEVGRIPSHSHGRTGSAGRHRHSISAARDHRHYDGSGAQISITGTSTTNVHTGYEDDHRHTTSSAGGGNVAVLQPSIVLHKIIKT